MTRNQIAYWEMMENRRSNLAKERETNRSNLANERETNRSNLAREAETMRNNLVVSAETNRANLAREAETNRNNLINESIAKGNLDELMRHNIAVETETARNNRANNAIGFQQAAASMLGAQGAFMRGQASVISAHETGRHNRMTEAEAERHNRRSESLTAVINQSQADLNRSKRNYTDKQTEYAKYGVVIDMLNTRANLRNSRSNSVQAQSSLVGSLSRGIIGLGGTIK